MSDFFESFACSELNQLKELEKENCEDSKEAINELDVIEESPTNSTKNLTHKSIRERFREVKLTQRYKKKQILKKNKSDSVLSCAGNSIQVKKDASKNDNFFQSTFNISGLSGIEDQQRQVQNFENLNFSFGESFNLPADPPQFLIPTKSSEKYDEFFQDSMDLANLVSTNFDTPAKEPEKKPDPKLFKISEELAHLDASDFEITVSSNEVSKKKEDHYAGSELDDLFGDSEMLAGIKSQDLVAPPLEDQADKKGQLDSSIVPETEDFRDTDNVSFVQQANDKEASKFLEDELKIQKTLLDLEEGEPNAEESMMRDSSFALNSSRRSILDSSKKLSLNSSKNPKKNESLVLDTSKNLLLIKNWNLPQSVVNEYRRKKVEEMFEWQRDCLINPKVLFEYKNLVYSAPTSAGKTLVSEILMIKNILERKKKALFILPFISVVREKMFYLQDLLASSGMRVEGMFGGYQPAGSFDSMDLIVLTIEKANSIINRLLEQDKLGDIGMIVIDEVHLISDSQRGYILELLLTKVLYICRKLNLQIQIVTMSATIPNLEILTNWLEAQFFHTDFRPIELHEMIKIGPQIYDNQMKVLRKVENFYSQFFGNDCDDVSQLCMETLLEKCQLIIFCPSKDWVEKLAHNLAGGLRKMVQQNLDIVKEILDMEKIQEFQVQAKNLPSGIDEILEQVLRYGVGFHHAGLTTDERDVIEMGFKEGIVRILVATSTLSSGVNLPARRVIIRSPMFAGKMMSNLTYKQMIGRAGRKGKDVLGESILICNDTNLRHGKQLISAPLDPVKSCLNADNNAHLKRALLEIIASGAATTKQDLENFVNQTLFYKQNQQEFKFFLENDENLKEMIRKNQKIMGENLLDGKEADPIQNCISFLLEFEFIRLQVNEETDELTFVPTRLGIACLSSSMPPSDGFLLFSELQKSRQNGIILESDLHAIYLVTPYSVSYQLQNLDWMGFFDIWDKLPATSKKVGELVGVKDVIFMRAIKNPAKLDYKTVQIHKRFYTALALQELVNEKPITQVAIKYKCPRGLLQSLQQTASTFAGTVTSFCQSLNWNLLALILGQFKERLFFGIHPDLIDLMKLPNINSYQARALFKKGIEKLVDLANSKVLTVENILLNAVDFDSDKKRDGENEFEAKERIKARNIFLTGKSCGVTVGEAAKLLIDEARKFVENELGTGGIKWEGQVTQVEDQGNDETGNSENAIRNEEKPGNSKKDPEKSSRSSEKYQNIPLIQKILENPPKIPENPPKITEISKIFTKIPEKSSKILEKLEAAVIEPVAGPSNYRKRKVSLTSPSRFSPTSKTPSKKPKTSKVSPIQSSLYRKKLRSSLSPRASGNCEESSTKDSTLVTQIKRGQEAEDPQSDSLNSNESLFKNSFLRNLPESTSDQEASQIDPTQNFLNILTISKGESFQIFTKKIAAQKEISLSIGVTRNKAKKSVIGANLLMGQDQKVGSAEESHKFVFDKFFYIDSLCFNFEKNNVCHLRMQEMEMDEMARFLETLFNRDDLTVSIFEAKEQLKVFLKVFPGIQDMNAKIQDPKLMNWLLDPDSDLNIHKMVETFAPKLVEPLNLIACDAGKMSLGLNCWNGVDSKFRASLEAFLTSEMTKQLLKTLGNVNKGHLLKVFRDLEMPIQLTLARMEVAGFPANQAKLTDLIEKTSHLLRTLEQRIYALNAGRKFNLSSSKEVGKVVGIHRNQQLAKHKKVSTSKQVLEKLDVPIAKLIIQHRTLSTTVSNMQSLWKLVDGERIYGKSFSFTQTGRISMYDPNLQNVTKDFLVEFEDAKGKTIQELVSFRSTFEPKDALLLSADFCQLEMRILTHLSQDKNLLRIMQTAKDDIFKKIAAKWNKVEEDQVSEEMRSQTKQICYGIIYGMGMKALAETMKIEEGEATKLCEEFHGTYPGIRKYTKKIVKMVQEKGFVETITGRRRFLPEIKSESLGERNKAERQALNTAIQGSAADLVKNAILRMQKQLRKQNLQDQVIFVLHMHDELIYQISERSSTSAAKLLKQCMENSIKLTIPLQVKVKLGRNWGKLEEIKI